MSSSLSLPRTFALRCKVWFMIAVFAAMSALPRPARAFWGVGDIVHDPLMMAGMMGQTGAQLAQLVQMYYLFVDTKNRYGSLTKIKTWQKLAKVYAIRSLQNLARQVIYDIRKRGARITSETPTNPVLSAMISGRRKMDDLTRRYNRADDLQMAYNRSQFSIQKLDAEQAAKERQAKLDAQAENDYGDNDAPAVAQNEQAYNARAAATYASGGTTTGGTAGSSNSSTTTGGTGDDGSSENSGYNVGQMAQSTTATNISGLGLGAKAAGSVDGVGAAPGAAANSVNPKLAGNPLLVTPRNPNTGDAVSVSTVSKAGAADSSAMLQEAIETMDAGVLQEMDAAVDMADKAREALADNEDALFENQARGPEPYLSHMIGQNNVMIDVARLQLRAQRAAEERQQMLLDMAKKKPEDTDFMQRGAYVNGLKSVIDAAKSDE